MELSDLSFRDVNRKNQSELRFIAEMDSKIPLEFDPYYNWDERNIEQRLKYYLEMNETDFFQVCVRR